jgi:hypothetical protein
MKKLIGLIFVAGVVLFTSASHPQAGGTFVLPKTDDTTHIAVPTECAQAKLYRIHVETGRVDVFTVGPHNTLSIRAGGSADVWSGRYELTLKALSDNTKGSYEIISPPQ